MGVFTGDGIRVSVEKSISTPDTGSQERIAESLENPTAPPTKCTVPEKPEQEN